MKNEKKPLSLEKLFASQKAIETEIELNGDKVTVFLKEMTDEQFQGFMMDERSEDRDIRKKSRACIISSSLVDESGNVLLGEAEAARLKPIAAGSIITAIMKINGFAKDEQDVVGKP